MRTVLILASIAFLSSCASQNDEFYGFYEPQWKPKKAVAVEVPAEETKVEETKDEPEERPTIIVRTHKLNPVYQGIKFLDSQIRTNSTSISRLGRSSRRARNGRYCCVSKR
jgi:hypothetical protein